MRHREKLKLREDMGSPLTASGSLQAACPQFSRDRELFTVTQTNQVSFGVYDLQQKRNIVSWMFSSIRTQD